MVQDSPSRRQDQFVLRLPDGMRERLKAVADANNRSMNAEIVTRLDQSLNQLVASSPDDNIASFLERPNLTADDLVDQIKLMSEINSRNITNLVDEFNRKVGLDLTVVTKNRYKNRSKIDDTNSN